MQLLPLTCLSVCLCRNIERVFIKYRAGEILLKFEETLQFLVEIGESERELYLKTYILVCTYIEQNLLNIYWGEIYGIKREEETKSLTVCSAHAYLSLAVL
jgi:hypothetical protein